MNGINFEEASIKLPTLFMVEEDAWLYGNLSPLVHIEEVEQNKKLYLLYAIKTNKVLREMDNSILKKIADYYKIKLNNEDNVDKIEKAIKDKLSTLIE